MKKTVLFLLLSTLTLLSEELITVKAECSEEKFLQIIIESKRLNLSEDAVIDNTGGYVDIPENSFYLKTADKVYYIYGEVINVGDTHRFLSEYKEGEKFITSKELYELKEKDNIKFIQKIHLEKDDRTVKNSIDIVFEVKSLEIAYQACH